MRPIPSPPPDQILTLVPVDMIDERKSITDLIGVVGENEKTAMTTKTRIDIEKGRNAGDDAIRRDWRKKSDNDVESVGQRGGQ
jgi:hypothetical protein